MSEPLEIATTGGVGVEIATNTTGGAAGGRPKPPTPPTDLERDDETSSAISIVDGANVAFSDVKYSVPGKKKRDGPFRILHGISGSFLPGRMTALMGPSGSGKTTLMDILAGRKNSGTTEGDVRINGFKPSKEDLTETIGYVEQFDTLVGELTVRQMLKYTAELKLPRCFSEKERTDRVEEVLDVLDLNGCRDTVIGNPLSRGVSGGQAKRVNIGLALITRPPVLFLDEPTSGLDSRTANEVVELLRRLAREGRTVVCTIHSPTGHAFARFDDLHMLHSGRTIFDGRLVDAQPYFESQGHARDDDCSLPEWLVDLTSELPRQHSSRSLGAAEDGDASSSRRGNDFAKAFEKSELRATMDRRRMTVQSVDDDEGSAVHSRRRHRKDPSQRPPGGLRNLVTLLKYRTVAHYKDGEFLGTRLGDKVLFSLLILSLYYGIGEELDSQSIQSTATLLYFVAAICGYGASAFVPSLALERALFYRELADGCYTPATYYMSKFIEEGIMASFTSLLFGVIMFFGCKLQGSFGVFFLSYYLTTMTGIILAYAVAALVRTMEAANAILPTIVTIWMYFGGLFIVFEKIPTGWYWFSWTSFLRYSWGSMMLNQFQNTETGAEPVFFGDGGEPLTVLEFYGLEGSIMGSVGACLGLLFALNAFFSLVGVLALTFVRHDKR